MARLPGLRYAVFLSLSLPDVVFFFFPDTPESDIGFGKNDGPFSAVSPGEVLW